MVIVPVVLNLTDLVLFARRDELGFEPTRGELVGVRRTLRTAHDEKVWPQVTIEIQRRSVDHGRELGVPCRDVAHAAVRKAFIFG